MGGATGATPHLACTIWDEHNTEGEPGVGRGEGRAATGAGARPARCSYPEAVGNKTLPDSSRIIAVHFRLWLQCPMTTAFLLHFQEPTKGRSVAGSNGDSSDRDGDSASSERYLSAGTQTVTEVKKETPDTDPGTARFSVLNR